MGRFLADILVCLRRISGERCPDVLWVWLLMTLIVGVLVTASFQLMALGGGLGLQQFLSGGDPSAAVGTACMKPQAVHSQAGLSAIVLSCWSDEQRGLIWLPMLLDSFWALCCYFPLLVLLSRRLFAELWADAKGENAGAGGRLAAAERIALGVLVAWLPAVMLLAVDLMENWSTWAATRNPLLAEPLRAADPLPLDLLNLLTATKERLIVVALAVAVVQFIAWFLSLAMTSDSEARSGQRAKLRMGVGAIIWRSRYVLLMLAIFAALALAMDQSRDVLAGIAASLMAGHYLYFSLAVVLSIIALWFLASGCWLWSRILARLRPPGLSALPAIAAEFDSKANRAPDARDRFAKWWARMLGSAPFVFVIALAGLAVGDAARAGVLGSALVLLGFGAVAAALALWILFRFASNRKAGPAVSDAAGSKVAYAGDKDCVPCDENPASDLLYFNAVDPDAASAACELKRSRYRFPFWLPRAPLILPLLALLAFQAVRALDIGLGGEAPLTLAAIALALTLWTCVFGLLAQLSLREGMPWVLILVVIAGFYSAFDLSDNHRILTIAYDHTGAAVLWRMWLAQFGIALCVAFALVWAWWRSVCPALASPGAKRKFWPSSWPDFLAYAFLAGCAAGILLIADHWLAPTHGVRQASDSAQRPALQAAIRAHVQALMDAAENEAQPVPVYFVSAEGGGIRAGYWAALVLDELTTSLADKPLAFEQRAFSISGVSGGSLGAAAWQVCRVANTALGSAAETAATPPTTGTERQPRCVDRLAKANLLTPLLSAWLFEDVLGLVMPSTMDQEWLSWLPHCNTPACGVLSRGHWFERSLEASLSGMAKPLLKVNTASPYLFLNSTRVEDGNRAIASRVRINPPAAAATSAAASAKVDQPEIFAASVDQMDVLGPGLPLSTAAHNSSRFTFVNAIGAAGDRDSTSGRFQEHYHLADGGYFDNSGGHTTADIIRTYTRCLFDADDPCALGDTLRQWAQPELLPQALQIRNGVKPNQTGTRGSASECEPVIGTAWNDVDTFSDFIAPIQAVAHSIGTGANGRVAEANICRTLQAWRLLRRQVLPAPAERVLQREPKPLVRLDLVDENVLYPLGWYLSSTAQAEMQQQADKVVAAKLAELQP